MLNINEDFDNIMYFLFEQRKRRIDVYSKMIMEKFKYKKDKVKRFVKNSLKRGLIDKITKCNKCGKVYIRVPEVCTDPNCKNFLIRQQGFKENGQKYPHYIIKLTEEGIKYVNLRLNDFYEALGLFRKRLKNIG